MNDIKTIKWIFQKTKTQNINFILLNLLNITYSILGIYLILVSKHVIDAAVAQSMLELKKYGMQLIIISLTEISLKAILASIDAVTRAKLEINFKQHIINTILKRNYEKIAKFHSGELMTRIISDVNIIIETLVSLIPEMLSMATRLICAMFLLFQISKEFVVILLLGGILLFIIVNLFKPYLKNIHKKVQTASANVRLFFKEVFENLLVIKIFQAEDIISKKAMEIQKERYHIQMKRRKLSITSGMGFNIIFQISYLYALIWSAYQLYLQNITVGGLTSIVQLISQIQAPIINLSRSFQSMFSMIGSAERIIELENIEEDCILPKKSTKNWYSEMKNLVVKEVDFTYRNKKIFHQANLEVNKGETIAIYGESGIGKSTLLKLILGIIKKDAGNIYFQLDNGEIQEINNETRNMFAYVPQGKFILSDTIKENITFVNPSISETQLQEALEVSQAKTFIEALPEGLNTKIGERGSGLSEGQLQRIAIARAIASQAPILILDEITSSLDSKTEAEVLKNIKKLKNRTCIIVTHRNSISEICDKEFIVENEKIKKR